MQLPLFPLKTVLFPKTRLDLQLFEPRYLEMAANCMKSSSPFGVVLIKDGSETGKPADMHEYGTTARIVDWDQLENGMLGITCHGEDIFRLESSSAGNLNLITGEISLFAPATPGELPASYQDFQAIWSSVQKSLTQSHPSADSTPWQSLYQFCDAINAPNDLKQGILESEDLEYSSELLLRLARKVEQALYEQQPG